MRVSLIISLSLLFPGNMARFCLVMHEKIPHSPAPEKIIWRITDRCDLDCSHCGSHGPLSDPEVLGAEQMIAIADQIIEVGCKTVVLTGGEPLVREDWKAIADHLLERDVAVSVVSNGTRFSEEEALWCSSAGLGTIHFSLDGLADRHDQQRREKRSYETVLSAMRCARERGMSVAIVTTITRAVVDDLEELHRVLQQEGVSHWQVRLAAHHADSALGEDEYLTPQEVPALVERLVAIAGTSARPRLFAAPSIGYFGQVETDLRGASSPAAWRGCTCGLTWCVIEPDGAVKSCGNSRTVEGSLLETRLAQLWSDPEAFAASRRFSLEDLAGHCRQCDWARLCRGGCLAVAEQSGAGRETRHCMQHPDTEGPRDRPGFWERRRISQLRRRAEQAGE